MIQPPNWSQLHEVKQRLSPRRERQKGVLDRAWQPIALIGDPPPLRPIRGAPKGVTPDELCPFLEPRANWTTIQVDFDWTSKGTDEFLGHGDEQAPANESR
jgi:hypothetical protein